MESTSVARSVGEMYTVAIERVANSQVLGASRQTGERNRNRHEALAQFMLDHILNLPGELELFAEEFDLSSTSQLWTRAESPIPSGRERLDHVIENDELVPIAIIEDKIDAAFGQQQLERYEAFLAKQPGRSDLIVLHPARRRQSMSFRSASRKVRTRFVTWYDLSRRMSARTTGNDRQALWTELGRFAETVGTAHLTSLPSAKVLCEEADAQQVQDTIHTAQQVAAVVAGGRLSALSFSMHSGNPHPWLQAGLTSIHRLRVGLELDVVYDIGGLYLGIRGPEHYLDHQSTQIGYYVNGKISAAGHRRIEDLAKYANAVERRPAKWEQGFSHRFIGRRMSATAANALHILSAVFHAENLRNPHRAGASDGARSTNEGEYGERVGVRLFNGSREVSLFMGPPAGQRWERSSIWIRAENSESEIEPLITESGRDYVLRVWSEAAAVLKE